MVWICVEPCLKAAVSVPDFQQQHSSPLLEMCPLFLLTSFPSQRALTLVALCIVEIQAEFEVYGLMAMCNSAGRMNVNFSTSHAYLF